MNTCMAHSHTCSHVDGLTHADMLTLRHMPTPVCSRMHGLPYTHTVDARVCTTCLLARVCAVLTPVWVHTCTGLLTPAAAVLPWSFPAFQPRWVRGHGGGRPWSPGAPGQALVRLFLGSLKAE